jgi:hypothetical protein
MSKTIILPFTLAALASVFSLACSSDDGRSSTDTGSGGRTSGGASGSGATAAVGGSTQGSGAATGTGGAGTGGDVAGTGGAVGTGGTGTGGASDLDCSGTGHADYGTASLLDSDTCLLWMRNFATDGDTPKKLNNKQAPNYCGDLVQDGYDDWRVPKPEELVTWPRLSKDSAESFSEQFVTHPEYLEDQYAGNIETGCNANSKSCNVSKWNSGAPTKNFANVAGLVVCVRGSAKPSSLDMSYSAAQWCASDIAQHFEADCSPYAMPY